MRTQFIRYTLLFVAVIFMQPLLMAQQPSVVSGVITDERGETIPGVNVYIENTTLGVTSGINGRYILPIPTEIRNPVLVFSFIGYLTQKVEVKGKTEINIVMDEEIHMLGELVVVGYEVRRKADLTGAVSSINVDDLITLPVGGLGQALQGRAAGVNITHNTGMPGEGVNMRIRGVGSISSSNDPLFIVDGVPMADALSILHPNDIESVSILKDAASSAIYGSRANNGVVLITTRQGTAGEPRVEFNSQFGFQQHGRLTPMTNRDQYIEMYNEAADNDNAFIENPRLRRTLIDSELAATLPDVNHLKAIFRTGLIQNQNISVSGGDKKITYLLSGNYFNQDGIIIGTNYERISGNIRLNAQVSDAISVGANINVATSDNDVIGSSGDGFGGNGGSVVRYAFFRTPAIPVKDENGEYVDLPTHPAFFGDGYNPVGLANYMSNNIQQERFFGNLNLQARLHPDIVFTSTFGGNHNNIQQRRFDRTWGTNNRINNPNRLVINDGYDQDYSWSNVLSYSNVFDGKHDFSAIFGSEAIKGVGFFHSGSQLDFPDQTPKLVVLGNGLGSTVVQENHWGYALLSFFSRANYTYENKYMVSATLRRDGSSRFAPVNRWGTFYSLSAAWRIDQEAFMTRFRNIDVLKMRAGFGAIGNQEVGNYAYSDQVGYNFDYPFGGVASRGYAISVLGNQNLQWETSVQYNAGIDLGLWGGKFNVTLDYFYKITDNMLVREPNPPSAGFADAAWVNAGKILNQGVELDLNYRNRFGELVFDITGNFGYLHNEVLELAAPILGGRIDHGVFATRTEEGYPIGSFFLYEMYGIFQNQREVDLVNASAHHGDNIRPGDVRYVDQNGDLVINEKDRIHLGSAIPKFTTGLHLSGRFRNFDFGLFFQGAFGHKIYYQVATDIEGFYRPFNLTMRYYNERWTGEGSSNTQPRASWAAKANNTRPSTRFLEDGSYLRLKNVQLGYNIPAGLSGRLGVKNLRVYFTAQNLLTFTKYPGMDPEMTTSDNAQNEGDIAAGIDWGTYPLARSFNLGIQLSF